MLVGEVFARMGLDSKQYEKGLDRLEGKTQKKALTLGSIFKGAFSFALGIGVVQGFRSLTGAVTDFVNTAARTDVLNIAMQSVARSSGYATAAVREHKDAIMELGIAEQEATQITTRFMQAQLDTADAARIARTAQDAAVIAGTNSSEAALKMTEAIAKLRPELLAEFGMTRNLNDIYGDYAKTLGKTATQLSEIEKKQAMLNYILAEGEKIAGTYEASMGAVGKQIGSLPRYWDTLKNALAKPLALPALSVIVDGITNSLKDAISWAEANTMTLQRWGQTAANVITIGIKGFKGVTKVVAENWAMIKIAATALITYAAGVKAVAAATALWSAVNLALKGQLAANIPLLGVISRAIGIYKTQMKLASMEGIIFSNVLTKMQLQMALTTQQSVGSTGALSAFRLALAKASLQGVVLTGVLAKLRVALFAFWSALGPIGWGILAISAAVGVGTHLWGKYAQSLQQTTQAAKSFRELEESTKSTTTATEEQADALEEAGKAAGKNIQSFDEVHQLQEDMAGSAEDMLDSLDMEGLGAELPELNMEEMLAGIEEGLEAAKPTLAGFWEWIKQGIANTWEWVKEKTGLEWWEILAIMTGPIGAIAILISKNWDKIKDFWEGVKEKWSQFWDWVKGWGLWQWLADRWDGIKEKWAGFKEWAANMWDGAKEKWGQFTDWVAEKWSNFWTKAGEIWDGIKTTVQSKWEDLKTNAPIIWEDIKTNIQTRWDNLKTGASEAWSNIRTTIGTKWDELKTNAPIVWENIKKNVADRWDTLKTEAPTTWENIRKNISDRWEALKTDAPVLWENIRKNISEKWENLKTNAPTTWEKIKTEISTRWDALKTDAPLTWESIRKTISEKWDELKTNVGPTWTSIKTTIAEKWEEIKGDAFGWGKNLIDSFIQGIKYRFEALKSGLLSIGTAIKEALLGEGSKSSGGGGGGGGGSGGGSTLADQAQASKDYYAANKEAIDKIAREKGVDLGVAASMHKVSVPKLATGTNYVPKDMLAFLHEGEAVVPKAYNPAAAGGLTAEQVEQAVYRAFVSAMRIVQASSQQDDNREIVLKIDNTVLARMQLPALSREAQRQGVDLIIRPQGV